MCKSTHEKGHTLDLVLTREYELQVLNLRTDESVPSDHKAVLFSLRVERPPRLQKSITFRRWKSLNHSEFKSDMLESSLSSMLHEGADVDAGIALYNDVLRELLDKQIPLNTSVVTIKSKSPWYNTAVRVAKSQRRKAERLWRKSRSEESHLRYRQACMEVLKALRSAKRLFKL